MIKLQKDNDVQFEIAQNQLKKYTTVAKVCCVNTAYAHVRYFILHNSKTLESDVLEDQTNFCKVLAIYSMSPSVNITTADLCYTR